MKKILFILSTMAILAGCSKEENNTPEDSWRGEIRLTSGITVKAGAADAADDVPDRQIAKDLIVSFFVDDASANASPKELYENYAMKAGGDGSLTKNNSTAEEMYYPTTSNSVDIYAFVTNGFASNTATYPTKALTHSVSSDQREQYGTNYLNSDLLYGARKEVESSLQAVNINFYHMLSKVEVALRSGAGSPNLTGAEVTILNTRLKADFLPQKAADITSETTREAMIRLTDADNEITPIQIGTAINPDFKGTIVTAAAVVVPQTLARETQFIKVALKSGENLYYTLDNGSLKLKSGYKYLFNITVSFSGLTVESTIVDWTTRRETNGSAELPLAIGSIMDPSKTVIGDFYLSDGSFESKDSELTLKVKTNCVGVVFYTKSHEEDISDYSDTGIGMPKCHGYVVALKDAGTFSWGPREFMSTSASTDGWHGCFNQSAFDREGLSNYPAANACGTWGESNSAPNSKAYAAPMRSSGWVLPAIAQLKFIQSNKEVLEASLSKVNGVNFETGSYYWSSTAGSADHEGSARAMRFDDTEIPEQSKLNSNLVRAILAF